VHRRRADLRRGRPLQERPVIAVALLGFLLWLLLGWIYERRGWA